MCKAMNDRTWLVTTVALLLLLAGIPVLAGAAELSHPVIRSTDAELRTWIAEYESAPPVPVDLARQRSLARTTGSKSLLSLIPYDTRERNQGAVANCWVWAGTGILEAAHTARDGVRDRLSVQWFDSTYNGGSGPSWAGNGGSLGEFVRFYNTERIAVPWSNPNASYQDGRTWCRDNQRAWVPAGAIGTEPHYDLETVVQQRIVTRGVGDAAARANIKAVLDSNRPVYLSVRLPDSEAWSAFESFWNTRPETAVFNITPYNGRTWSATAGAHAVLVVGYDDTDPANPYWLVLNSWGDGNGLRPKGTYRLSMNLPYDGFYQGSFAVPSTEWQTLQVEYDTMAPTATPTPVITPVTPGFDGSWETESGLMVLHVSGRNVTGTYEIEAGRIAGTLSPDGRTLTGTWSDGPTYAPPDDQGTLVLVLSGDGASFEGHSYSADMQRQADLSGRRVAATPGPTPTVTTTPSVRAFPSANCTPRDVNGDGRYEDINGNGRTDFADVVLLFNHLDWCCANQPVCCFDFNRNGRMDFGDVVTLYEGI
ncbi:MAG TPA: C1 family peptidase [Methanoregulaceae archaeon]|nr:C1 family peptidase [Methanoregulaceae archaeon]